MDGLFGGPVSANDNRKACKQCSALFAPKRRQIFCCAACRRSHEAENRDVAAESARRLAASPERTCERCGMTFRKVKKDKLTPRYCSKRCSGKAGMESIRAAMPLSVPPPVSYSVLRSFCRHCGIRFSTRSKAVVCSDVCRVLDARARSLARSVSNDNVDRTPRQCMECGKTFSPEYGNKRKLFCSDDCGKKSARRVRKKKEKARLRVAFVESVDPIKVFERDRWKCQECGCKTPRTLRGTYDDRAPELDHIMPLALGGAHSYLNTQCLCRKCNAAKSDTPPAQVSLFAYGQ